MKIDTIFEWLVIAIGLFLVVAVIHPIIITKIGDEVSKNIPDPNNVAQWLRDHGL